MRVHYQFATPEPLGRARVVVSSFDGVDRDQVELLRRAHIASAEDNVPLVAVLLWPSARPQEEVAGTMLTTLSERLELLARGDLPAAVLILTDPGSQGRWLLSDRDADRAESPLRAALAAWCEIAQMTVAPDCDADDDGRQNRQQNAAATNPNTDQASLATRASNAESVRAHIEAGELGAAEALLGHSYTVGGTVFIGDQRGRQIGFPTANLRPDPRKVALASGVYAARVRLPGEVWATHPAVINVGTRPTFNGQSRLIEVHLLDASIDLYGQEITVELVARLRAEVRFSGIDALRAQIGRDVERARSVLEAPRDATSFNL